MTPAARLSAAIEILDRVLDGAPAEKVLTNWARGNRYAGSGDRHAIRDVVFDALRCKRSYAHLGGAETGRGLVIGGLRAAGSSPENLFTGEGYAPPALSADETVRPAPPEGLVALDCPDWLAPALRSALGDDFEPVMAALQKRASVFLRINSRKTNLKNAVEVLESEGITTQSHPLSPTALEVTGNPRRIQNSKAFTEGLIELQDVASQAVVDQLPLSDGMTVLDYCAGGGGKSLAMAGRFQIVGYAHDIDPGRMGDISIRAKRAGVSVTTLKTAEIEEAAPFDLVLADVPCSGSGSWRRAPEAKWALTPERLDSLCGIQAEVLRKTARLVAPKGYLAYATCSLLPEENQNQIDAFMAVHTEWRCIVSRKLTPLDGGDGFFVAILTRDH